MNKLPVNTGVGLLILLATLMASCTSSIEIEGFSSNTWKADRNGCKGLRVASARNIMGSKEKILGQTEHGILKLMGRPDKNELYRRQQKFYIYYLEPGPLCEEKTQPGDSASYLSLRFNATGVVNEVFIYE